MLGCLIIENTKALGLSPENHRNPLSCSKQNMTEVKFYLETIPLESNLDGDQSGGEETNEGDIKEAYIRELMGTSSNDGGKSKCERLGARADMTHGEAWCQ